jgi:hypothetical protein
MRLLPPLGYCRGEVPLSEFLSLFIYAHDEIFRKEDKHEELKHSSIIVHIPQERDERKMRHKEITIIWDKCTHRAFYKFSPMLSTGVSEVNDAL